MYHIVRTLRRRVAITLASAAHGVGITTCVAQVALIPHSARTEESMGALSKLPVRYMLTNRRFRFCFLQRN